MRREQIEISDLEICKTKIEQLLKEYNCRLMSDSEWHDVLIYDKDTKKSLDIK